MLDITPCRAFRSAAKPVTDHVGPVRPVRPVRVEFTDERIELEADRRLVFKESSPCKLPAQCRVEEDGTVKIV